MDFFQSTDLQRCASQSNPHMMTSLLCIIVFSVTLQVSNGARMGPKTPQPGDFRQCRLSDKLKEQFVDLHNEFRSQVKPSAADMEYVVS